VRHKGETFIDGTCPSTLQDFSRKLTFLPAGHAYFEWHQLQTPARLLFIYLDPAELDIQSAVTSPSGPLDPRLFFEDASLWSTVEKLKALVASAGRRVCPTLRRSAVLMHELLRLSGRATQQASGQGGLAAWQGASLPPTSRITWPSTYPGNFGSPRPLEPVPLQPRVQAVLQHAPAPVSYASPYRARQILLERHALSVTDIGLSLGFNRRVPSRPLFARWRTYPEPLPQYRTCRTDLTGGLGRCRRHAFQQ
jgi:AraC family transcriptional regulator